jgi:hypothetical protein
MGYTAWSVVFGEVPTETKWNLLGANDDSFNDGTGILDDSLLSRHFADDQITLAQLTDPNLDYREIARDTATGLATQLACSFDAYTHLMVICAFVANASGVDGNFKFNADTGANYAQKYSGNFAAPATDDASTSGFAMEVGNCVADGSEIAVLHLYNPSGGDKLGMLRTVHQTAITAATVPSYTQLMALWNNGSQVTSIQVDFDVAVKAGSELIVMAAP